MENLVGKHIGRYHIIEQLGQGGMAVVFKAYDLKLERDVAVKVIRTEMVQPAIFEQMLKRFEREARSLAKMEHPNIVSVFDYGDHEGAPYLVMQYLPGGTLKHHTGQPMPYLETIKLLLPIADALSYAHERNVLHRDVKPANILITDKGVPMLSDFGIAKILESDQATQLTVTGMGLGTPHYMAPEQWRGQALAQTDVYALGVVFYELLTGRRPYDADTPAAILEMVLVEPLARPKDFVPGLPDAVEKVLFKALAKKPGDRYPTMSEFAKALEQLAGVSGQRSAVSDQALDETLIRPVNDIDHRRPEEEAQHDPAALPPRETAMPTPYKTETPARNKPAVPIALPKGAAAGAIPLWVWIAGGVGLLTVGAVIIGGMIIAGTSKAGQEALAAIGASAKPSGTFTPEASGTPQAANTLTETPPPSATATPTQAPSPEIESGALQTSPKDGMVQVYVDAGNFEMGSTEGESGEAPVHTIYLNAYWIDRTEVTNAMYAQCVQAGACAEPSKSGSYDREDYYGNVQYDDYPVFFVDWYDASAYCEWAGRRLPTEAEWEKAARGTDGRTYPWGNEAPNANLLNYDRNVGDTTEAGSYPSGASPYGVLDMAGNVMEWVSSLYGSYPFDVNDGREELDSKSNRVLRGGSWNNSSNKVRSANRAAFSRGFKGTTIGFRCVTSD